MGCHWRQVQWVDGHRGGCIMGMHGNSGYLFELCLDTTGGATLELVERLTSLLDAPVGYLCHRFIQEFGMTPPLPTTLERRAASDASGFYSAIFDFGSGCACCSPQVSWLGTLLPRLLTTPNGSQRRLPTSPYDDKHTLLLAPSGSPWLPATSVT